MFAISFIFSEVSTARAKQQNYLQLHKWEKILLSCAKAQLSNRLTQTLHAHLSRMQTCRSKCISPQGLL